MKEEEGDSKGTFWLEDVMYATFPADCLRKCLLRGLVVFWVETTGLVRARGLLGGVECVALWSGTSSPWTSPEEGGSGVKKNASLRESSVAMNIASSSMKVHEGVGILLRLTPRSYHLGCPCGGAPRTNRMTLDYN